MISKLLKVIFIFSFLLVSLVGVFMISHSDHHSLPGNCAASLIDNLICPQNLYSLALHHLSVFQLFSQALIFSNLYEALILTFLLLALYLLVIRVLIFTEPRISSLIHHSSHFLFSENKVRRWLSLFENSPTFILSA